MRWGHLIVVLAALALIACGGEEESTDTGGNGGTGPAAGTPDVTPEPGPDTPEPAPEPGPDTSAGGPAAALLKILAAVQSEDYGTVYDMLAGDSLKSIDDQIAKAKDLVASAGSIPGAGDAAKAKVKDLVGVDYDQLMTLSSRDAGAALIGQSFADGPPGVFEGEIEGEPRVEGDKATLTVKKPNGKTKDVEMVQEDGTWHLVYDLLK